jgi:hypothetical protein
MNRFLLVAALAAGCGSATDDRPATLDYITEAILAPSCAGAECHSAFKRAVGDQFDTPAAARQSIVANSLAIPADRTDPDASLLITTLTVGAPSILSPGSGNVRMPYDAAMPDVDIDLIREWIRAGVPGAQCTPNAQNLGCSVNLIGDTLTYAVVDCKDGNIGTTVQTCTGTDICTFYSGNGQCVSAR